MNIVVFDTETTSLDKPFCYNIGYSIYNTEEQKNLLNKDFVVEQVWHNKPLFESAYYKEKRPLYINSMRARKTIMEKFGYIMQEMIRDFRYYDIQQAYAYNSSFDDKVINYNCNWFNCNNPFDNIPIFDIRGYVFKKIAFTKEYQTFAEENKLFTEKENYSTKAEAIYRYISGNKDFCEEHTALADSLIEAEILFYCIAKECEYGMNYTLYTSVPREQEKTLIITKDKTDHIFSYTHRINAKGGNHIYLR